MPDNVPITAGSGTNVATDDIGGVHYQRVKPAWGVDGVAVDVSAAAPLPVDASTGELIEALEVLRMAITTLARTLSVGLQPDASGRLRVLLDSITASLTLATISTVTSVTTVATVTNQAQVGGVAANDQVPSLLAMAASSARRNITVT